MKAVPGFDGGSLGTTVGRVKHARGGKNHYIGFFKSNFRRNKIFIRMEILWEDYGSFYRLVHLQLTRREESIFSMFAEDYYAA